MDIREVESEHPDAVTLLAQYFDELRERLVDYRPPSREELRADAARGVVVVGYDGGAPVGTGALRRLDDQTAEVKRMFITQEARGRGNARTILHALEERARAFGCARIVLDTAAPLQEAANLYVREGYLAIARYNDNPVAAHWFEKRLPGVARPGSVGC
jgi:GNAT superfamily N-acetyltransferase